VPARLQNRGEQESTGGTSIEEMTGGGGGTVAMGPREQALALRASMTSTHKPIMHRRQAHTGIRRASAPCTLLALVSAGPPPPPPPPSAPYLRRSSGEKPAGTGCRSRSATEGTAAATAAWARGASGAGGFAPVGPTGTLAAPGAVDIRVPDGEGAPGPRARGFMTPAT
jgi:hypothetical protein